MSPLIEAERGSVTWTMIAATYYTPAYLILGTLLIVIPSFTVITRIVLALVWIYLVPPFLCRLVLWTFGVPLDRGTKPEGTTYKVWWWLTQVQMLFNRISVLEEILRLMPGAYGLWLNLWGSRVSLLAYWAPGVLPTDRYLLRIGRGAVLGTRSLISGHVATLSHEGAYWLTVAPVTVEDGAIIGAYVAVGPGCHIHAHEVVPAGRILPPYTVWKDGRKTVVSDA